MPGPLMQDDDLVHAVLDFIDNFDTDLDLHMPVPTSPSTPKRPRIHSGQRVRIEIQRLRASVVEMEARVLQLKQRRVWDATPTSSKATRSCNALVSRSWEDIAQRQKAQCQHAQLENARLRGMVVYHARVARKLERVVSRVRCGDQTQYMKRELIAERVSNRSPVCYDRLKVRTLS